MATGWIYRIKTERMGGGVVRYWPERAYDNGAGLTPVWEKVGGKNAPHYRCLENAQKACDEHYANVCLNVSYVDYKPQGA